MTQSFALRSSTRPTEAERLAIDLDRDVFMRRLLRVLAGTMQDVIGIEDTSGYVSVVGTVVGEEINGQYRRALQVDRLTADQVAQVLVDLKRRIQGDFFIIEQTEDRIVLGNRACPFGDMVRDRPSLCMMTSNVFGHIAAENLGYAAVELKETIARGHPGCHIIVHLRPSSEVRPGVREYFKRDDEHS